jgi:hypothetical protein
MKAAMSIAAMSIATMSIATAIAESASRIAASVVAMVKSTTIESATIKAVAIESAAIPGAGANEESAGKPFRTIVPIGRAGVWSVVVVAILAIRRATDVSVTGPYPNTHGNLSLRVSGWND